MIAKMFYYTVLFTSIFVMAIFIFMSMLLKVRDRPIDK